MSPHPNADRQVLEIIIRSPGTAVDEMVLQCPNLTWNQVFLAIDRLNREGTVTLIPKGWGHYSVDISDQTPQSAESAMAD